MLDFMMITVSRKKEHVEIKPKFMAINFTDLMIRGGDFYAIWNEEEQLWSTKESVALYLIDRELDAAVEQFKVEHPDDRNVTALHMWDVENGMIDRWHKYVQKQCRDQYVPLDEKLIFSNMKTEKKDYASRKLPYPLEDCDISAYDELISTLYAPEERHKLEWAIGSIVAGDSKNIQKFIVLYGAPKTGKSTIINIIQELFKGYTSVFDSAALGSASMAFALEAFRDNPLVAIQHDGDMSRIENNARINSLVSHEDMVINVKFKSSYQMRFNSFLIMGTNKPVRITDAKSGLMRRLIDVSPTGDKIPKAKYDILISKINFELGGIAKHCLEVYKEDPKYYDNYQPVAMLSASNDFYNFVLNSYDIFKKEDGTTLKIAYEMYKIYCDDAKVPYPYPQRVFKEELKSYFKEFQERSSEVTATGTRPWNVYKGFLAEKFQVIEAKNPPKKKSKKHLLSLAQAVGESLLDIYLADCPAQYASSDETPLKKWVNVKTTLKDLDTSKLHYVKVPENLIVIDFDLKDEDGNKSFELNAEAAAKWPPTYAEVSKGGQGIHLHYIYTGDVSRLSKIYDDDIEIKVFTGNSSLRRKLSLCNDIPIASISSGLPLKEDNKKMIDFEGFKNDKALRTYVKRALNKEYAASTRQSISLIYDALEKAYASGMPYDISDMAQAIMSFAGHSTNSAEWCYSTAGKMKLKSEEPLSENFEQYNSDIRVFFDIEVFPNLLVVVYKAEGKDKTPVILINPSPRDIEELFKMKLIGFNNRNYDNHILYARMLGETNEQLFARSNAIIKDKREAKILAANNVSYTDIYDFAAKKQSLKKWEIELGIHHQELGIPWDEPVPEDKWQLVAEYCVNDVVATEATFNALSGDFLAREILASLAGGTVNDTTNTLTTRLIFNNNKKPQSRFQYRNMALPVEELPPDMNDFLCEHFPEMMAERHGEAQSMLPYFPGYEFNLSAKTRDERSQYRGHFVGEGGFVWSKPGMYTNVITFDVASMHPSSIGAEYLFGEYTKAFYDILRARIAIKHKDYESAKKMFDGKLAPFLTEDSDPKALSQALKIAINSVYGLTAASFSHPFKDPRNVDNIVAKRGALFMVDLLENVLARGGNVIHIKTDSIKVADPSPELQDYILKFGKRYGYTFEIEHKFEKICLVNDAVYIAKCALDDDEWIGACKKAEAKGKPAPSRWTATGTQFAVPYVFKTLFSHEPLIFDDYCMTKSVSGDYAIYLDMNETLPPDEHNYIFVGRVGQFVPIKDGYGGGMLVKHDKNKGETKYDSVNGAKGYRWLESEIVQLRQLENAIDDRYFKHLVDEAANDISKYGDFEWFRE